MRRPTRSSLAAAGRPLSGPRATSRLRKHEAADQELGGGSWTAAERPERRVAALEATDQELGGRQLDGR